MSFQNTDQNEALSIGAEPQLFVDDAIVSAKRGVVRTLHPGKKLAQPVLLPDRPWEGGRVYINGTVHFDADAQQFRMWYLTHIGRGHQHRAPGLRERQGDLILYATSSDGLNWEKPELGLHEFDGSRANNILIFDKHSPTVIADEAADPSERYKMAAWDWSRDQFGYWVAHSADGLVWNAYDVNPILMNSTETLEAITVAHHSRTGEYFAFHRRWGDIGGFDRRLIAVCTSRNFLDWSEPELIIVSDEEDDAWTQDPEQRGEFYGMSGFVYGDQFLGFLPVFNVYRDMRGQEVGAVQSPWDGPIEAQLVHSRDGRRWERFADRSPIITRGGRGASTPVAFSVQPTGRSCMGTKFGINAPPSTRCTAARCLRRPRPSRGRPGGWTDLCRLTRVILAGPSRRFRSRCRPANLWSMRMPRKAVWRSSFYPLRARQCQGTQAKTARRSTRTVCATWSAGGTMTGCRRTSLSVCVFIWTLPNCTASASDQRRKCKESRDCHQPIERKCEP